MRRNKRFMTFHAKCTSCEKIIPFEADALDITSFRMGIQTIQEALPYLTADERELIISGTCGKCFDEMFDVEVGTEE